MNRSLSAPLAKAGGHDIRLKAEGCPADDPSGFASVVNRAIQECNRAGGGTVVLPEGTFLSASIELESDVTLEIPRGTLLRAAPDSFVADERISVSPTPMPDAQKSLIKAFDCQNVSVIGEGTVDGAQPFSVIKTEDPFFLIFLRGCEGVHISGLTIRDGPYWLQGYLQCRNLEISHLKIDGHVSPHNDGLTLASSRDAWVHHIECDTDDDAICLKTAGNIPCENITIEDCTLSSHCNAIKLGTQSHGDFRNITIRRCRIRPSRVTDRCYFGYPMGVSGLSFQMNDSASVDDIIVEDVEIEGTQAPVFLLHWNRLKPQEKPRGRFGTVTLRRVTARTTGLIGSSAHGHPEAPIETLIFEDCSFLLQPAAPAQGSAHGGATLRHPLPYPDGKMFGPLPGKGFFFRNVSNLDARGLLLASAGE